MLTCVFNPISRVRANIRREGNQDLVTYHESISELRCRSLRAKRTGTGEYVQHRERVRAIREQVVVRDH